MLHLKQADINKMFLLMFYLGYDADEAHDGLSHDFWYEDIIDIVAQKYLEQYGYYLFDRQWDRDLVSKDDIMETLISENWLLNNDTLHEIHELYTEARNEAASSYPHDIPTVYDWNS